MSVLPLTNAVSLAQTQSNALLAEPPGQTASAMRDIGPEAVAPTRQSVTEPLVRDGTAFAGMGAGAGGDTALGPVKALTSRGESRPPDAAPRSVINAQAEQATPASALPDGIAEAPEMPDPLPTSPFLKRSGG